MATISSSNPVATSNELSISQLVEKISKREELQSKYPYLTSFEDASLQKTNPKTTSVVPPNEIEGGGEPTHGSVQSRFSVLPPIAPDAKSQVSSDSGGSENYAPTDTSVSLSEYLQISRSNSRACDCSSPCVHQVLEHPHEDRAPASADPEVWAGKDAADSATPRPSDGQTQSEEAVTPVASTGISLNVGGDVDKEGQVVSQSIITHEELNNKAINSSAELVGSSSSVVKLDVSTNPACDSKVNPATSGDNKTPFRPHTPSQPEQEVQKPIGNKEVQASGPQPDNKSTNPAAILDVNRPSLNSTLPCIEAGNNSATSVKSPDKPCEPQSLDVKQASSSATRDNVASSGSDMPRSSTDSGGSSSVFGRVSRGSSSSNSGYAPSPREAATDNKRRQLSVVSLRGNTAPGGQFPQLQSPNLRPGSELSNVPYRHRLKGVSQNDGPTRRPGKLNTPITPAKVIVMDEPSVRDNVGLQHLKSLQNQMDFTSINAPLQGVGFGVPDTARPITVNGVVSQDRGREFIGEADTSIIDAVSQANEVSNFTRNNALPGKFRYAKVTQPKKGNFSLKNILTRSASRRKKKNATADNPEADKPVKPKDGAWQNLNADDVSFPASYLANSRASSDEDLTQIDLHTLEASSVGHSESRTESKKSMFSKFKKIFKPKSKVKKFTAIPDEEGDSAQPEQVRIQDGSEFMGALLPENVSGDAHMGNLRAQGSGNKQQQQRPNFVRHMMQMQARAREASRHSYINGQQLEEEESVKSAESGLPTDELLAQVKQGPQRKVSEKDGTTNPLQQPAARPGEQPKMYYTNVAGERLMMVDPEQLPIHDQIVMDPNALMFNDPLNQRVWVPPNTPHVDSTDFYLNDEGGLYSVQENDRVLAALQAGNLPYDDVELVIEGEVTAEWLAMAAEQGWVAEEITAPARRADHHRLRNHLQVIKEEDENRHSSSSEFGDDEASEVDTVRSEPDGQSTPSPSRRGSRVHGTADDQHQGANETTGDRTPTNHRSRSPIPLISEKSARDVCGSPALYVQPARVPSAATRKECDGGESTAPKEKDTVSPTPVNCVQTTVQKLGNDNTIDDRIPDGSSSEELKIPKKLELARENSFDAIKKNNELFKQSGPKPMSIGIARPPSNLSARKEDFTMQEVIPRLTTPNVEPIGTRPPSTNGALDAKALSFALKGNMASLPLQDTANVSSATSLKSDDSGICETPPKDEVNDIA